MANLTIDQPEVNFLRDAVIRKYCERTRQDPGVYQKKLTGTMKHYVDIAENIADYLDTDRLRTYVGNIGESSFRRALKKYLEEEGKPGRNKMVLWQPTVTDNIVRKLLFTDTSKSPEPELTFKDYFILAFYIYIGLDRTEVLNALGQQQFPSEGIPTTLRPEAHKQQPPAPATAGTIDPYHQGIKCTLRPLDVNAEPGEAIDLAYRGEPILLNRMNLDPGNNTITTKVQAVLNFENGQWSIENVSELKTTYIKVLKRTGIEKRDIRVFGNKHFLVE